MMYRLGIDYRFFPMQAWLCLACVMMASGVGAQMSRQDSLAKAKTHYDAGVKKYESGVKKYTAKDTTAKRDWKAAEAELSKAVNYNPQYAEAYNTRGEARLRLEDLNGAIFDYTSAIKLSPQNPLYYYNRAVMLFNYLQMDHDAIRDYGLAIQYKPDYSEAWNNRGLVWLVLCDEEIKSGRKAEYEGQTQEFKTHMGQADHYFEEGCADIRKAASLGLDRAKENVPRFCSEEAKKQMMNRWRVDMPADKH